MLATIYGALSIAFVFWALHVPVSILTSATHDDALFWTHARHLVEGRWLGPYDVMTLAKGPGFSLVLAVNHWLGSPITFSLALLYVLACFLVTRQLANSGLSERAALVTFTLILFHPSVLPTRVIRDDIYASLTLIAVAGALRVTQTRTSTSRSLLATGSCGFALGLLWITREEGVWIVPGLLSLIGLPILATRRDLACLKRRTTHAAVFALAGAVVVGMTALTTLVGYGRFVVSDFKDPSFMRALKALNAAEVEPEIPFVPVPTAKREALYTVSPSFAELRHELDGKENEWKLAGCDVYPSSCGDFAGGWWVWALRDAVAKQGYYETPTKAARFYDRLTQEITDACASGGLTCRSNPLPFMPNVPDGQLRKIPSTSVRAARLVTLQEPPSRAGPSWGPPREFDRVRSFLGNPVVSPPVGPGSFEDLAESQGNRGAWPITLLAALFLAYRLILAPLAAAGFLALLLALIGSVCGRRQPSLLLTAAVGFWLLLASRIAVLVLVDISSFPAIDSLYMSAGFPLLLLASVVSIEAARGTWRSGEPEMTGASKGRGSGAAA